MDLRDFGSTLARWWYLTVATVLLAIGAAIGLYMGSGATYTANSTVLLLPPKAVLLQAQQEGKNYAPNNPLLYLDTLTNTRDVLVRNLGSADITNALAKKAPGAGIAISTDPTSGSPLILVKSTGSDAATALSGVKAVDGMVAGQLKTLQDQMDIQSLQRISSLQVTEDTTATASHKTAVEMAVVGFVGVLVLGLAAIAVLDNIRSRRKRQPVQPGRSDEPTGTTSVTSTASRDAAPEAAGRKKRGERA